MKNSAINVFIFIAGAAAGSAATWIFVKKKYEQLAQEEIDSVKEVFARRNKIESVCVSAAEDAIKIITEETSVEDDDYEALSDIIEGQCYISLDNTNDSKPVSAKPYVIPPEEFGEREDYDQFSLTYYSDGILTDENDCTIEDVESVVGVESLSHFGEYEDDSVFVRDDGRKTDYEILFDQRNYSDVLKQKPYLVEDE